MFSSIRKSFGNFYFRKELEKISRERKYSNFHDARQIGILYELNEPEDYDIIAAFVASLQQEHKEVKALGFVRSKNMLMRFLPKLSFDFFSSKDLNWYMKPGHGKVKDFMSKKFDFLIDLSLTDNLPLKYISGLSAARCRIGKFEEKNKDCYDFMLSISSGTSLDNYIKQVTHYLTIINTNADQG